MKRLPLIVRALREPGLMAQLPLPQWDLLLRQAACTRLTATLLALAEERGQLDAIPAQPREHFEWVRLLAARHQQAVRFETARICAALAGLGLPLVLLKGAAYVAAGLPAAQGRLFSDIDILVPKRRLGEVEAALMMAGWATTHHDPYDQRYYRQWMHELPPMRHVRRQSVIDVHHAILPETAAVRPEPARLLAAARALPDDRDVRVLAPADMVLHSAAHLFHGEFEHGLRDLFDL
ncbi:MAG TPA: nucleotidyltransferase family protein, partial [Telluria sp.]|nr:nucleotidyltransferase family protein [Telluria sp.]